MRTVQINGAAYRYTFGMGAMMIYETLTGESMTGRSIAELSVTQTNVLHYACLRNGSNEYGYSFAEYMQQLNERAVATALAEALAAELLRWNTDNPVPEEEEGEDTQDSKKK